MNPCSRKSLLTFPHSRYPHVRNALPLDVSCPVNRREREFQLLSSWSSAFPGKSMDRREQGLLIRSEPALLSLPVTPRDISGTLGPDIFSDSFILTSLFPFFSQKHGKGTGEGLGCRKSIPALPALGGSGKNLGKWKLSFLHLTPPGIGTRKEELESWLGLKKTLINVK